MAEASAEGEGLIFDRGRSILTAVSILIISDIDMTAFVRVGRECVTYSKRLL